MTGRGPDHVEPLYDAGFVFLSYLVSLVGCVTTLELLHRRTSRHGAYNWYLLVTSSITMGGIGIWCMHFIGNRAIIMAEGKPDVQIVYNTGFTSVSFFLPIVVLSGAFYLLGATDRINRYYIAFAGVLMGVAVGAMHYVGQLGISNYHCTYGAANVVGASIISIVASMVALKVFFRLRETWTDSWWKRVLCGLVLACAVSGMHWTATVGTKYRFKGLGSTPADLLSRKQTVIVCTTLSVATCLFMLLVALLAGYRRKRCRSRAQQLVLACGYFDEAGRIMVTTEGALPTQKIANHYVDKTFGDQDFSCTHPAFIWAFRASYNWHTLKALIPGMKGRFRATDIAAVYYPHEWRSMVKPSASCPDFSIVFKELFSLAALDLANQIHQPLEALGTLFEEPLETGRHPRRRKLTNSRRMSDLESGAVEMEGSVIPSFLSAGKFLFVIRQVNKSDVAQFGAAGFRFASVTQISHALSKTMELPTDELAARLHDMQAQSASEKLMPPGLYLACFMLRPRLRQGFDILVPAKSHNQLPTVRLPYDELTHRQGELLKKMDNCTVSQVFEWLEVHTGLGLKLDLGFCRDFLRALTHLVGQIHDPSILQAKFSARVIEAPCQPPIHTNTDPKHCLLVSIHMISTIYTLSPKSDFTFIPLRSFTVQQQVHMGVADQEVFARQAYLDFAHCFEPKDDADERNSRHSSRAPIIHSRPADSPTSCQGPRDSLRQSNDEARGPSTTPEKLVNSASGAIAVSNLITVDITDALRPSGKAEEGRDEMGTTGGASTAALETETYVDKLFALCRGQSLRDIIG